MIYKVTAANTGSLHLTLDSFADLGVYVRTDCNDDFSEIACEDVGLDGDTELLIVPVTQGDVLYVFVDGYDIGEESSYQLQIESYAVTCGDGIVEGNEECDPPDGGLCGPNCTFVLTEVETNDGAAQANPWVSPFFGAIYPEFDEDWVSITVPGPSSTLTAEVADVGNDDCPFLVIDSEVEIFGTNGVSSLAFNDDGPLDYCSITSASGLAAGTYFVRVRASQQFAIDQVFLYKLLLTVQ